MKKMDMAKPNFLVRSKLVGFTRTWKSKSHAGDNTKLYSRWPEP